MVLNPATNLPPRRSVKSPNQDSTEGAKMQWGYTPQTHAAKPIKGYRVCRLRHICPALLTSCASARLPARKATSCRHHRPHCVRSRRHTRRPAMAARSPWTCYQYLPLSSVTCIRLVQITRPPGTGQLRMALVEADLDDPDQPAYQCLSCTWGPSIPGQQTVPDAEAWFVNESPLADDKFHQTKVAITPSLQEFLDEFRRRNPDDVCYLWIDALCINQEDLNERAAQVQLMARIYSSCDKVIAWLGAEDEASRAAAMIAQKTRFITKDDLASVREWYLEYERTNHEQPRVKMHERLGLVGADWLAFAFFMNRNWFYRKWILQEAYLASALVFWCGGGVEFRPRDLLIAIRYTSYEKWWDPITATPDDPLARRCVVPRRVYKSWFMWSALLNPDADVRAAARLTNGSFGVVWARDRGSSDARDSVYAILSFLEGASNAAPPILVDYTRTAADVFTEFSRVVRPGEFAVELEGRRHRRTPGLPSWVPDYAVQLEPTSWVYNGGNKLYSAGGNSKNGCLVVLDSTDARIMAVPGIMADKIRCAGGRATDMSTGRCFVDALMVLDLLPWTPGHSEDLIEAFWRTLLSNTTASRHPKGEVYGPSFSALLAFYLAKWGFLSQPESHECRTFRKTLANLSAKSRLDLLPTWEHLLDLGAKAFGRLDMKNPVRTENEMRKFLPYLWDFRTKFSERCFFITEHGRMGIGPEGLKAGTRICTAQGSQYPLLLEEGTAGRYKLLSIGYVHSIMFSEALRGREFVRIEIE